MRAIPVVVVVIALQAAGSPALAQRLPFQQSLDAAGVTTLDVSTTPPSPMIARATR